MKLRLTELTPLLIYANQIGADDQCTFLIKPEGHPVDAVLGVEERNINLQITLAAPLWGKPIGKLANPGYQHHQTMLALNEADIVSGWPPFVIEGGVARGMVDCLVGDDRDNACLTGLESALSRKSHFHGRECTLAVLARDFYFNLLDFSLFEQIVQRALRRSNLKFQSVAIFDSEPGFFVEQVVQPAASLTVRDA
jgi:hypothetical protein